MINSQEPVIDNLARRIRKAPDTVASIHEIVAFDSRFTEKYRDEDGKNINGRKKEKGALEDAYAQMYDDVGVKAAYRKLREDPNAVSAVLRENEEER